ncbi:NERD domain-containing protein [Paenarthrobacter sp. DKR-5]|uniref:nuclease-related domain-containing protein n=1 Tax=Paenarthrobacter sp. DKR-5 TaxID=2835535 RepID=UPI001BDBDA91|nr:nuclease-related domain-containing protein [Paenarthrobacter sp. DKR-5]MBT1004092.1 NERD domain-containing protein [Paenarthrobacter sp. DKR-5]
MTEVLRAQRLARPRPWPARLFGASPLPPEAVSWYKGALGEIAVGALLAGLGPEWTVLHAVPVGAGTADIDHVLIGPSGVYTLNTKNHSGQYVWVVNRTLMVAGKKQPHLRNAAYEAKRASRLLSDAAGQSVPVKGVLVLVLGSGKLSVRECTQEVAVVTADGLLRWLKRRDPLLSPEQVRRIASVAERPETWRISAPAKAAGTAVAPQFRALHAAVRRARRIRSAWLLAVPVFCVAAAVLPPLLARVAR